jgi:hypothetical protein
MQRRVYEAACGRNLERPQRAESVWASAEGQIMTETNPSTTPAAPLSVDELKQCRELNAPLETPVCRVCGGEMRIGASGPRGTDWYCSQTKDDLGNHDSNIEHWNNSHVHWPNRGFESGLLATIDERDATIKQQNAALRAALRLPTLYRKLQMSSTPNDPETNSEIREEIAAIESEIRAAIGESA